MQYTEAIDYLYSRLPVFHRIGPKAIKPGLGNTILLCEGLGNPHQQFTSIHVAGTNGKGSTSHMLAAIYQSAGYRVGLYTSPHLKSFTERIRLNGQPIPEDEVVRFVEQQQPLIESVEPSFFEVTVAMAFDFFARHAVDVAIIEVGLGGRLDSTNVITPVASVITNIGYDHTDILGDTLPLIAAEKAGIIKPGVPVIIGESHPETQDVFTSVAASLQAPITFADRQYLVNDLGLVDGIRQAYVSRGDESGWLVKLDLLGTYQLKNLPGVVATVNLLQRQFPVTVTEQQEGLASVSSLTGLTGRFQTLRSHPTVIADTAHNQSGLEALFETIRSIRYKTLRIIIGLVADKDRSKVLSVLPTTAVYYFCQANTPRSLSAQLLQQEARAFGRMGDVFTDVNTALAAALEQADPADLLLITGSNYTIAELTNL
ncbi:folylpolyglutamate synthase/dihydrofolate synthase family protein [Spirosoma sp.]|uniref:bifunctional folylpolyglutamate synthase/dihydrofolate synthase n=1 Tax=Spirosoma sp. TaxID=1899569 RepID=UPI0026049601|nr:folylpolyglutamate synthase/dihydrofolate synthase family protein [Spirosoma sp.]MCX6216255.1 bifunctional folylpolyglutamate synthase/dihydrofolate synthase [Spirosoma sp.]